MGDVNTDKIDFGRVAMLLDVVHKCAGVGTLTSIAAAAMTELTKLNGALKEVSVAAEKERQRVEAEANAKAYAEAQAKANAEDDAERKPIPPRSFPSTNTETLVDRKI